ncbi:MAG: hypothetical protein NZM39_12290 [Bernardetiaceae bacterium]|nr:hypothetical protein [Bernardetiaceae bacterium]
MKHPVLFVASRHDLTRLEIEAFKTKFGTPYYQEGCGPGGEEPSAFDAVIVHLKDVAPELHHEMANVSVKASANYLKELARKIVAEAAKVGATHFYCVGEPSVKVIERRKDNGKPVIQSITLGEPILTMWAYLFASGGGYFQPMTCVRLITEHDVTSWLESKKSGSNHYRVIWKKF